MRRRAVLIKSSSRLGVMREHPHQIAGGNDAWRFAFGQRRGATRRLGRDIDAGGLGLCAQRADGQILALVRSEEHTSGLQSLMRISYAVFCLKKKKTP